MCRPTLKVCLTTFRLAITTTPTSSPRPRPTFYRLTDHTIMQSSLSLMPLFHLVRSTDCRRSSFLLYETSLMNILQRDSFDPPNLQVEHPSSLLRRRMAPSDFV